MSSDALAKHLFVPSSSRQPSSQLGVNAQLLNYYKPICAKCGKTDDDPIHNVVLTWMTDDTKPEPQFKVVSDVVVDNQPQPGVTVVEVLYGDPSTTLHDLIGRRLTERARAGDQALQTMNWYVEGKEFRIYTSQRTYYRFRIL